MPEGLRISNLAPDDLFTIERQPSQATLLGVSGDFEWEEAEALSKERIAWTARDPSGRIIACFGINEPFEGVQGIAWSVLAPGIGASHLELTRFCRSQVLGSGLARVELLARATDIEEVLAGRPELDTGQAVALAMWRPSPECRWAQLLGFRPAHVLRRYGARSETYMLFEWFGPAPSAAAALLGEAA